MECRICHLSWLLNFDYNVNHVHYFSYGTLSVSICKLNTLTD